MLTAGLLVAMIAPPAVAAPTRPDLAQQWTATHDGAAAHPSVAIDWDVPITMSDGVQLRANVYRPADADGVAIADPTPTIVNLTPYTKMVSGLVGAAYDQPAISDGLVDFVNGINLSGTPVSGIGELVGVLGGGGMRNFSVDYDLIRAGYTQVVVDVRGTGFSQGVWQVFGEREQQDTVEVIDWAAHQPWSNGRIGMSGVSYSAINQLQAAARQQAALQAIVPVEGGRDIVRDIVAPGGGFAVGFVPAWLALVNGTKWLPNVQSILQGTFDWKWLADRQASPLTFSDLMIQALTTPDLQSIPPELSGFLTSGSPVRESLLTDTSRIRTPMLAYGGWRDIFHDAMVQTYTSSPLEPGRKQLVVGDTYHLNFGSDLGRPGSPPRLDVWQRAWFDRWLKDIDNGVDRYGPVTLQQKGTGEWVTAPSFPRPGMTYQRLYLDDAPSGSAPHAVADGSLVAQPPGGSDRLTVAPNLSTVCSPDAAVALAGVAAVIDACGADSRIAEGAALTFTTAPVAAATELSGPIGVRLNAVHDTTDGYWVVTINDVAPDGTSTMLSSGQMTSSLRAIDDALSTRAPNGDYTRPVPYLTLDRLHPVIPGVPTTLDIGLPATDAVLAPGHRLRVDVWASDVPKSITLRPLLNASQLAPQHVQLDPNAPSYLTLPTSRPVG